MSESEYEREQEQEAGAEAAAIGGRASSEPPGVDDEDIDPAMAPLNEAGEGEAEGFELSERQLIEHASHGDEHAAHRINEDASYRNEERGDDVYGEADEEHTSEGPDEER
jgi:hypothetical protein